MSFRFALDIPNGDSNHEWTNIDYFETKEEAIAAARRLFGADRGGRICLISELPKDDITDLTNELEPFCQEENPACGKGTRGNYVTCSRCRRILCDSCDFRVFSAEYYNGEEREYEVEEPHCFACRLKWLDEWEECGSCGGEHPPGYTGDCRNNMMRRP